MPNSRANEHLDAPADGAPSAQAAGNDSSTPQAPMPTDEDRRSAEDRDHARLAELEAEVARLDDRYKRAVADLDNYRKRSAREAERRVAEEREGLLRDWLDAVDSVERALRIQPEDQGLRAVLEQMEAILSRQGVVRLGAVGEQFDPARHEAIAIQSRDEVPDRTVLEVARSGFAIADERLLRPAQVVVSRRSGEGGS
jgi:molecular chaperone GrpE